MKQRYKSVLTPSAQTAKVLQPGSVLQVPPTAHLPDLESKKHLLGQYYFVALIQFKGGCRISEVLSIRYCDILLPDRVLIRGKKGSRSKIVSVPEAAQLLQKCAALKFDPFRNMNRFTAYRNYKKAGIMLYNETGKKAKVTHAFRHKLVDDLRSITSDKEIIKDSIGHNSVKSQSHYGKKY